MQHEENDFRTKAVEFIESAQKELEKLQEELRRLEAIQVKCSDLQIAIDKAKVVAGVSIDEPEEQSRQVIIRRRKIGIDKSTKRDVSTMPMRDKVHSLLLEFNRPMKDEEIVQEFYKRGWKLSRNNGVESIRIMLWRNKDIFMKVGERLYNVIK